MENREIKFRAWNKKCEEITNDVHKVNGSLNPWFLNKYLEDEDYILMQYTGLKDKDGKDIYEGDILDFPHKLEHEDGIVKWIGNGFWLETLDEINNHHWPNEGICKITGNIYENPGNK